MSAPSPDLQIGRARTVTLHPLVPFVQPKATVYSSERKVLLTPPVTASALSTTVAEGEGTTRQRLKLSARAEARHGLVVLVEDPVFGRARARVSGLEGDDFVRLVTPLPAVPAVGSAVVGLDLDVDLPAFAEAALANILEVEDLANPTTETVRTDFNVVAFPFLGPCRPEHVRALVSRKYAGERTLIADAELHDEIADEVNNNIRGRLLGTDIYISSFWSPAALQPVRLPMIQLVLAEGHGYYEAGVEKTAHLRELRIEVDARMKQVQKGRQVRDVNNDQKVTTAEAEGDGQNSGKWER